MRSFNGVELKVGQRVITNEDDEYFNRFVHGTIRDIVDPPYNSKYVVVDVDCDDYGRTRVAADLIVLLEDNL